MTAFYNEIEPYAAAWLRNLIDTGHIAPGIVDERDIRDIRPDELARFTQCHFFAGIGVWSYALRQAGWPDDRPIWTGSCPCQPFSAAGRGDGAADERHLWPHWHHLIAECRPPIVLGEQVEAAIRHGWLDLVQTDMEGSGYACGAVAAPAAGFGAPHIRARLYFAAQRLVQPGSARLEGHNRDGVNRRQPGWNGKVAAGSTRPAGGTDSVAGDWRRVAFAAECDPDGDGWCQLRNIDPAECDCIGPTEDGVEYRKLAGVLYGRRLADPTDAGCERGRSSQACDGRGSAWVEPERLCDAGWLALPNSRERDGIAGGEGCERNGQAPGRQQGDCESQCSGEDRGLADADGRNASAKRQQRSGEHGRKPQDGGVVRSGDSGARLDVAAGLGRPGPVNGFWRDADWLYCRDDKWRPVEPGIEPLAHGAPARVGRLRAYGNAICAPQATAFVEAVMECAA